MSEKSVRTFRVFLCHASDDKQKVRELYKRLTDDGLDAWLDEEKLLPGQDWKLEISKVLENTDAIIICLSKKSISKEGFVQKEIKYAIDIAEEKPEGTIFLIPARLDECAVPRRIADKQYVDLYVPEGYQRLLLSLSSRAESLGIQILPPKPVLSPSPDISYELSRMIKEILRDDEGLHDSILHLAKREPEKDGWFHKEICKELQHVMSDQSRPIKERARAGDVLAQLGDPRFRPDAWYLPDDDFLGFVEIPAGPFQMGNDTPANKQESQRESPQHPVALPTFYINRYPVTVAQYRAFLMETNSLDEYDLKDTSPDNHPVTSVTWYDALQYCSWLMDALCKWSSTPQNIAKLLHRHGDGSAWTVTLPSEAEWEKAARGMADARIYPWGPKANPNLANYAATGLKRTSAVGCFAGGGSPYDVQDMSGNVWEWTRSNWGANMERPLFQYPYIPQDGRENVQASAKLLKVLRGGSCLNSQEDIRCSCRGAELPHTKGEHIGFRLAITLLTR